MPRSTVAKSNTELARAYAKAHKLRFDVAYHLMRRAVLADGRAPRDLPDTAGVPLEEAALSPEDQQALGAARTELGI